MSILLPIIVVLSAALIGLFAVRHWYVRRHCLYRRVSGDHVVLQKTMDGPDRCPLHENLLGTDAVDGLVMTTVATLRQVFGADHCHLFAVPYLRDEVPIATGWRNWLVSTVAQGYIAAAGTGR